MQKSKVVLVPPEVVNVVRWVRFASVEVGEKMVCLTCGNDQGEMAPVVYRVAYSAALDVLEHAMSEVQQRLGVLEYSEELASKVDDVRPV